MCWGVQFSLTIFGDVREMDREVDGRWCGISLCDNQRSFACWTNALPAYEERSSKLTPPGPGSRVDAIQLLLRNRPYRTRSMIAGRWRGLFGMLR